MKTMIEELTLLQKENQQSQADRMSAITAKNQQENNVIQQLKAIVSEKEAKVKQLEQDLMQLKQAVRLSCFFVRSWADTLKSMLPPNTCFFTVESRRTTKK